MDKSQYLNIKNLKILNSLPNKKDGEIVYLEDEDEYRIFKNGEWQKFNQVLDSGLTIYDLNKQMIKKDKPLSQEEIDNKKKELNDWRENKFYLLYGKEISYFTLFALKDYHIEEAYGTFAEAVFDCLNDITSEIYSIQKTEDNAYEFWINYNGDATVLYLFDYTKGIVKYGK